MPPTSLQTAVALRVKAAQRGWKPPQDPDRFIPQKPTARQKLFLDLRNEKEVFYGGAAGGGKSSALLMAALEYVHVRGYSALILRKTYADLAKPGALLDRAQQWLRGKAHWSDKNKTWTFPTGSTLSFGYIDAENDKFNFQGAEFQFIGFDETSQFTKSQYAYLFSRLRRLKGSDIPIRMRAASNPGGLGSQWVNERFIPEGFTPDDAVEEKVWSKFDTDEETGDVIERYFVPARLDDNPHLDQAEYELSLRELDPVTRAQLRRGDWQITTRGDILYMWSEPHVIITWSQFDKVFGSRHIPLHWKLGVLQDWGSTDGHPCVTMWFATAALNSPKVNGVNLAGSVFCYRSMMETQCTAMEIKQKIYRAMLTHNEIPRTQIWDMSHEASSERLEYNRVNESAPYALPFRNWETGRTRGIEQLKHALTVRDDDVLHPFKSDVYGRPMLYFLVDDDQAMNPKTEAGMLRIRQEAPAYKWATPKSGETAATLVPYALFNDACLVTNTLIETKRGAIPIQNVTSDDLVLTRQGFKATMGAYLTNGCAEVKKYQFSNGSMLTATPNHPLFFNKNFAPIDVLRVADIIEGWTIYNQEFTPKLSRLMERTFSGIRYRRAGRFLTTSIQNIMMPKMVLKHFILKCGNTIKGIFHAVFMFIMWILTVLTMPLRIWSVLVHPIIEIDIAGALPVTDGYNIWRRFGHWQANGTKVKSAENGMYDKPKTARRDSYGIMFALDVESPIRLKTHVANIVRAFVKGDYGIKSTVLQKKKECVHFVRKYFQPVNMPNHGAVRLSVQSVTSMPCQAVFNLTVQDCPEYFANGLLVHNCDVVRAAAVRYFPTQADYSHEEKVERALAPALRVETLEQMPQSDVKDYTYTKRLMEVKRIEAELTRPIRGAAATRFGRR